MTDRVLSMLAQYLLSNQSLALNETFQVYLKVLSIDHSNYHTSNPPRYDQDFNKVNNSLLPKTEVPKEEQLLQQREGPP